MKLQVVAVGQRMPAWVDAGVDEYARRMPRDLRVELREIKPAARGAGRSPAQWLALEAERVREALRAGAACIVLDERGTAHSTAEFAHSLQRWRLQGRDVAFVIGGADGTSAELRRAADGTMSLSRMTLPHGLCRVMLSEQLYRVATLLAGHPYHRA